MNKIALAVTVCSVVALAACKKEAPAELPPAPQNTSTPAPADTRPTGPIPGSQEHFRQIMAGRDTILFDTDMFNIDAEDQAALREQATYLGQYPTARATIEGHADERGTREYNLALGERRANAAKNYLVGLGVAADRLTVVSYGKERPVAIGSDERSWARNRRAVTVVMN
jgi:peptidoglycan-associated lipoprotein